MMQAWGVAVGVAMLILSLYGGAEGQLGVPEKLTAGDTCMTKINCSHCIQTPDCGWCRQPVFTAPDGSPLRRCHQQNRWITSQYTITCGDDYWVSPDNEVQFVKNEELTKASSYYEAVQIQPQSVRLKLRIKEAYHLEFHYAQAEDYPVDLYYLMDLSKSMEDDKDKLSVLGDLLAERMSNITSNFRLGFGSFVDKVVMPYVSTVPKNMVEPCRGCAAPYGYFNVMPLSQNTSRFAGEVKAASVSGNLDAPEGGFDAIMQAIVCREQIGWRDKARRLLVFSTDAGFHYAGDGKLGGIVKPNDGECHLSPSGEYTHSILQDYPSVSQINYKVKENSINLIFAVTIGQVPVYGTLKDSIEGASAGQLSEDSSNVVDLVEKQYQLITSAVEMKDNSSSHVKVQYFSSCLKNQEPEPTNKCEGLKVGNRVTFTAKIEVTKCPEVKERRQIFHIYPVGINESLTVDLETLCDCDCEKPGNPGYIENAEECSGVGIYKCGICDCDGTTYFGRNCECSRENYTEGTDYESGCSPDNSTTTLCSNRGRCECGVCQCDVLKDSSMHIYGDFCECDNFSCDRYDGLLCSGADHGECDCGECDCISPYTGLACECYNSTDTCKARGSDEICSGHGECVCGSCICFETKDERYSGDFCEQCPTCPGLCEELKACVQCQAFESGPLDKEECANCTFVPIEVDIAKVENEEEQDCTFIDDDDCRFTFVYGYNENSTLVVRVQKTKECPPVVDILGIVLGVIGAIVAIGLAVLVLWKVLTTIHDKREFAKFEKERKMARWDTGENPIFKQATSTFKNPTYGGK